MKAQQDPDAARDFGARMDFGRTASDYSAHRAGFPPGFFRLLSGRGYAAAGMQALDLGTGTGTVARGLARLGLTVTGTDPAEPMLAEAEALARAEGLGIRFRTGHAERIGLPDASLDLVTAGQCWHWFDRPRAAAEARRVLRPGGRILIAHFDWLALAGNMVAATEELILRHSPDWSMGGGTGIYPLWLTDLGEAGFTGLETASFDTLVPYSPEGWRGRIRASAGVKAHLSPQATEAFDAELADLLQTRFPGETLQVPHRVWLATGLKP